MTASSPMALPNASPNAVLDPFGGVAGDMLLGALVDLGADLQEIQRGLQGLDIEPWSMSAQRVTRRHFSGLKVQVQYSPAHHHRHLADILRILRQGSLPAAVLSGAEQTFQGLAQAEGLAHGMDPEQVHFHEVGAADAILDICGVHYAMHLLGLTGFWVSALPSGSGWVDCAHGRLPCPVPATLRLLEDFDLLVGQGQGEMVTPTGAALVATLGRPLRGGVGPASLEGVGYGAGSRAQSLCRVWKVEPQSSAFVDTVMQEAGLREQTVLGLSCELDDCDPQVLAYLCQQLLQEGALDVRLVPTHMKKGRAAQSLELLVQDEPTILDRLVRRLILDSTTLGLRVHRHQRYVAVRSHQTVRTPWGPVRVKVADFGWHRRGYPEYEDCAALAKAKGVALAAVQQAALAAWEQGQC